MSKPRHVHGHVQHRHPVLKKHPALRKNYCFGCGKDNPEGMRLKFVHDEAGKRFVAHFRLGRRFTGPPRHAHGGIIAVILDEAMSKSSKLRNVLAPTMELTVRYLKPVPLGERLTARRMGGAGARSRAPARRRNPQSARRTAGHRARQVQGRGRSTA